MLFPDTDNTCIAHSACDVFNSPLHIIGLHALRRAFLSRTGCTVFWTSTPELDFWRGMGTAYAGSMHLKESPLYDVNDFQ